MEVRILSGCYDDEYPICKSDLRQINSSGLWGVPIAVEIAFDLRDAADMSAGVMVARLTQSEAKLLSARLSELVW